MKDISVKTLLDLLVVKGEVIVTNSIFENPSVIKLNSLSFSVYDTHARFVETYSTSLDSLKKDLADWEVYVREEVFYVNSYVIPKPYTMEEFSLLRPGDGVYRFYLDTPEAGKMFIPIGEVSLLPELVKMGLIHKTAEAAMLHREALLSFYGE